MGLGGMILDFTEQKVCYSFNQNSTFQMILQLIVKLSLDSMISMF